MIVITVMMLIEKAFVGSTLLIKPISIFFLFYVMDILFVFWSSRCSVCVRGDINLNIVRKVFTWFLATTLAYTILFTMWKERRTAETVRNEKTVNDERHACLFCSLFVSLFVRCFLYSSPPHCNAASCYLLRGLPPNPLSGRCFVDATMPVLSVSVPSSGFMVLTFRRNSSATSGRQEVGYRRTIVLDVSALVWCALFYPFCFTISQFIVVAENYGHAVV